MNFKLFNNIVLAFMLSACCLACTVNLTNSSNESGGTGSDTVEDITKDDAQLEVPALGL